MFHNNYIGLDELNKIFEDLTYILVSEKRYQVVLVSASPNKETLHSLPITSPVAFVRCDEGIFYVNRLGGECTRLNASEAELQAFDSVLKPTKKARMLRKQDREQIKPIFDFSQNKGIVSASHKLYEDLKPDCGRMVFYDSTMATANHLWTYSSILSHCFKKLHSWMVEESFRCEKSQSQMNAKQLRQISMFANRVLSLMEKIERVSDKAEANLDDHLRETGYDNDVQNPQALCVKKLGPLTLQAKGLATCTAGLLLAFKEDAFEHLYYIKSVEKMKASVEKNRIKCNSVILTDDDSEDELTKKAYFISNNRQFICADMNEPYCVSLKLNVEQNNFLDTHLEESEIPRKITHKLEWDFSTRPTTKKLMPRDDIITKDAPLVSKHGRLKNLNMHHLRNQIKEGMFADYSIETESKKCKVYFMAEPVNSAGYCKNSNEGHLYLYENKANDSFFYYHKDEFGRERFELFDLEEQNPTKQILFSESFDQNSMNPQPSTNHVLCDSILSITSFRGHTFEDDAALLVTQRDIEIKKSILEKANQAFSCIEQADNVNETRPNPGLGR